MQLLSRIYTWSVALEPLLFFVVAHQQVLGVGGNISRLLQAVVVLCLFFRFSNSGILRREVSPSNRLYLNYTIYFVLTCISGIYGLMSGAYTVNVDYSMEVNWFIGILSSQWFRPFFEYFIAIYYFVYFAILPQIFLKNEKSFAYFFKAFFFMFNVSLLIGFIDYIFYALFDAALIERHLMDGREVGGRFHGLFGEPRDAFVYLILGLAMNYLRCYQANTRPKFWWLSAVILAVMLTESASGLIGLAIFLFLLLFSNLLKLNKFVLALSLFSTVILPPLLYFLIENSARLTAYAEAFLLLWDALEGRTAMPHVLIGNSPDIFPIYQLTVKAREFNLVPLFIGSGLGSASAINNIMGNWGELVNPHSQLIRVIYESGLIGLVFLVLSFYKPIELLATNMAFRKKRVLIILTLLLIGVFLGHRSSAPYIFLGIAIAAFRRSSSMRGLSALAKPLENSSAPRIPATGH